MLAGGTSKKAIAKGLGVAAHTVSAWVKLPAFTASVNQHLSSVEGEALQVLKAQRLKAAEALGELLDSKAPAVRLAAARTVLEITASKAPPTEASAKFAAVLALLESTP
jgi:hypothetical protein